MFEQISGSIYAVSADQLRIDGRRVYLRGQTVDVGSYGGCVNAHDCLRLKKVRHIFMANRYLVLNKEQQGSQKSWAEKKSPWNNS